MSDNWYYWELELVQAEEQAYDEDYDRWMTKVGADCTVNGCNTCPWLGSCDWLGSCGR